MVSINSLVTKLRADYPALQFQAASESRWSHSEHTVYYIDRKGPAPKYELMHELGHAINNHSRYRQDIELITLELEAWETTESLAPSYGINIPREFAESHLDSYRDWLHARSRCPRCDQAGIQERQTGVYRCLLCHLRWEANPAKQCGLRRIKSKTKTSTP